MRYLNRQQLLDITNGAHFLASGGGGAMAVGLDVIEKILTVSDQVTLLSVDDIKDDDWGCVLAAMGSCEAEKRVGIHGGTYRAFHLLSEIKSKPFGFAIPVETGDNIFLAMLTAVRSGIGVLDGDGAGRAVPSLAMLTFSDAAPVAPFVIASEADLTNSELNAKTVLYAEQSTDIETMARPFLSVFSEIGGIAGWAMSGQQLRQGQAVIPGTISRAERVGSVLREAREKGLSPLSALQHELGEAMTLLFEGRIVALSEATSGGFDRGVTEFEVLGTQRRIYIVNQNENLIAWDAEQKTPLVTAPDLICYLRPDGTALTNADTQVGDQLFVCAVKADSRLYQQPLLKAFQTALQNVGYFGEFIHV
jgi:DUF917 family protein